MPGQKWPGIFCAYSNRIFQPRHGRALPGPPQIDVPELQMEKISGIVLRSGPRTPAAIRCRAVPANPRCTPQRLKIRIPQMELHGGILRRDVDPVSQTACPPERP